MLDVLPFSFFFPFFLDHLLGVFFNVRVLIWNLATYYVRKTTRGKPISFTVRKNALAKVY